MYFSNQLIFHFCDQLLSIVIDRIGSLNCSVSSLESMESSPKDVTTLTGVGVVMRSNKESSAIGWNVLSANICR